MSTSTGKNRSKLSKAELKAYRARRAAERQRVALADSATNETRQTVDVGAGTSYTMTRDEEWLVIKRDLRRLLIIVAVLVVLLIILTVILR